MLAAEFIGFLEVCLLCHAQTVPVADIYFHTI